MDTSAQSMGEMLMSIIKERRLHRQAHLENGIADMLICYSSHAELLRDTLCHDHMLNDVEVEWLSELCLLLDMGERLMELHRYDTLVTIHGHEAKHTAKWIDYHDEIIAKMAEEHRS